MMMPIMDNLRFGLKRFLQCNLGLMNTEGKARQHSTCLVSSRGFAPLEHTVKHPSTVQLECATVCFNPCDRKCRLTADSQGSF